MYGRGPMEREIGEMIYRYFPQKPYVFKPLKDHDPSSDYPPHLGKIDPVLVEDSADSFSLHILDRYGVLTEERARVVEKSLYERGFQAYRIQGESPYTHLVRMNDLDDGWQTTYLVEGAWFPTPVYHRKSTVELMGNVDWTERFRVFRGGTVVVVPSRNEPYGMVIVEAIKCGVPVLYTDEAGVAERFDEKIGACSVNDEDGLANQLKGLLYDYSEWETTLEKQKELYIKLQRDQHFDEFLDLIDNQKAQSPNKGS
jgi:glycosyltransferase involved in cell wall biosynthesis